MVYIEKRKNYEIVKKIGKLKLEGIRRKKEPNMKRMDVIWEDMRVRGVDEDIIKYREG